MKKVCFVQNYSSSAHRGVGFYATRLLDHLHKYSLQYAIQIVPNLHDCDLIHYPFFDLFSHSLPIFSSKPRIVSVLDVIPLEFSYVYQPGLRGTINFYLQKLALNNTISIISLSQASANQIHRLLGIPKDKITVTYLAADPVFKKIKDKTILLKFKKHYNLPDEFVLYVGGINYNKNLPNLIISCKQVKLPLVIVGKEATEITSIAHFVKGPQDLLRSLLGIYHPQLAHISSLIALFNDPSVLRLGFVPTEDLVGIYNLASVYCQPSFSEGFGLNVLEAIACGTPVAVSNTSSLPEIVGENGSYFDPYDSTSIASALNQALGTKPTHIDSKFSWENTARQTLQVYNSILCD